MRWLAMVLGADVLALSALDFTNTNTYKSNKKNEFNGSFTSMLQEFITTRITR